MREREKLLRRLAREWGRRMYASLLGLRLELAAREASGEIPTIILDPDEDSVARMYLGVDAVTAVRVAAGILGLERVRVVRVKTMAECIAEYLTTGRCEKTEERIVEPVRPRR